ncbi:hypothetical protein GCM10023149_53940 [Mucilaginibacter gynuensis]|uniref:Uncharacterized protein n=1 Tax=Mucilaginibacter gynuensis TaxID=1302236 RepID=A0ABP8HN23_9SPHI
MNLSIKQRLLLPHIFSENKDSITEAAVQRDIRVKVMIEEDEALHIALKQSANGYHWDAQKGMAKEVEFTQTELNYLKESIYTLSRAGGITQDILSLVEKIASI